MKFLITSSLIIGTVFLFGTSTSLNAIDMQSVVKSNNISNIVKVRGGGGRMGGGNFGGHHGNFSHEGNFHHGDNFAHHGGWNNYGGVGVGVGVGIDGGPGYIEGPGYGYDTGTVCVGPYCPELEY